MDFNNVIDAAIEFSERRGVSVSARELPKEKAGEFDGAAILVSTRLSDEWRAYYLVHSIGSIVGWCMDVPGAQRLFDELRDAKKTRETDPGRLDSAVQRFLEFEERASEYSVQILQEIGAESAIPSFSLFFRADMDAMTMFHRDGRAPSWPEFLDQWKADVASGKRTAEPFRARPIPPLELCRFPTQEVMLVRG